MFLENFPIIYRNFSDTFVPLKTLSLGHTDVDFGFIKLDDVHIKVLEFSDFNLIEFRKKEFRIAIDPKGNFFEYEIFKNLKNQKLKYIFDFFADLFHKAEIKFNFSTEKYEFSFHNHIEHFKFVTLSEFLLQYERMVSNLKLYKYKNLSSSKNSFYELDLLDKVNNINEFSSWINAKIRYTYDLNIGDTLNISRLHKMKFDDLSYDIEELISIVHPLTKEEIKDNVIDLKRKAVKVVLKKVYKREDIL